MLVWPTLKIINWKKKFLYIKSLFLIKIKYKNYEVGIITVVSQSDKAILLI